MGQRNLFSIFKGRLICSVTRCLGETLCTTLCYYRNVTTLTRLNVPKTNVLHPSLSLSLNFKSRATASDVRISQNITFHQPTSPFRGPSLAPIFLSDQICQTFFQQTPCAPLAPSFTKNAKTPHNNMVHIVARIIERQNAYLLSIENAIEHEVHRGLMTRNACAESMRESMNQ